MEIGIAAIDCGADAVYIAGPEFGARQAAGNSVEDIAALCRYASAFGVRIFVTLNTILYDNELDSAKTLIGELKDAGIDALIVQDLAVAKFAMEAGIPIHASTQCAIRAAGKARWYEKLGFSRLVLERELSLRQLREIRSAVDCELECFVHGALCVCYSGNCYLSEHIAGRSANRGACIQACRSRYDVTDENGRVILRNKAVLSLKDFNLESRLEELAQAGVCSFKIEGRLKGSSYVQNVVREYSQALDRICAARPGEFARASFGRVERGFTPDLSKTFNRGYTSLFIDGKRGQWSSMDITTSVGEEVGTVLAVNDMRRAESEVWLRLANSGIVLSNGDGFAFDDGRQTVGFRGDVCEGSRIRCKKVPGLKPGTRLYRNISAAFEKALTGNPCLRGLDVTVRIDFADAHYQATARSEDGREVSLTGATETQAAENQERMRAVIESQLCKNTGRYRFRSCEVTGGSLPFMRASQLNEIRRRIADELDRLPCRKVPMYVSGMAGDGLPARISPLYGLDGVGEALPEARNPLDGSPTLPERAISYKCNVSNAIAGGVYRECGAVSVEPAYELSHREGAELMRSRYCIRHELGLCPKQSGDKPGPLYLENNGRRLRASFDCARCEMSVSAAE